MKATRLFFSFIFLSLLTACGEDPSPLAIDTIDPSSDETGRMEKIIEENGGGSLTLYQAILLQGVPKDLAKKALEKFEQFRGRVKNSNYLSMIDFRQHSGKRRFYMVHRASGRVDTLSVAHGTGSDPDNDGYAQYFSNIPNSRMSSLGTYLIAEKYVGKYGESLRLDGLEKTNSNARARAIVLHPSNYVVDGKPKQGRSWGCPAVPYSWIKTIISRTQGGSFLYAYGVNRQKIANEEALIEAWNLIPRNQWVNESEEAPIDGE